MRVSAFCAFLLLGVNAANAIDFVHVVIAPRSLRLPASGNVVFDVYWVNESEHSALIPSLDDYDVVTATIFPGHKFGKSEGNGFVVDHPSLDRRIGPYGVVHDQISSKIQIEAGEFAEVFIRFTGEHRKEFTSNTVVFAHR